MKDKKYRVVATVWGVIDAISDDEAVDIFLTFLQTVPPLQPNARVSGGLEMLDIKSTELDEDGHPAGLTGNEVYYQ